MGKRVPYRSLAEAGAAVGRTRSAILKAIKRGAISATRDPATGGWLIEPAELHRVFPAVSPDVAQDTVGDSRETRDTAELRARLEATELRLADALDQIADLRRRLDTSTAQLGEALTQVRLLTGPPRRSWLPWRR